MLYCLEPVTSSYKGLKMDGKRYARESLQNIAPVHHNTTKKINYEQHCSSLILLQISNSDNQPTSFPHRSWWKGLYENKYLNRRSSQLLHRRKVGHWHNHFCITEEKVRLVSKIHSMTWNGIILKTKIMAMKYALFLFSFLLHSIGTYMNMLIKIPSPAKEQPHDEPVNHMKSLMNNARGNNRPFPTIANSTVFTESPLMLAGVKKFVHIWATGPHMNKRVAVQADTLPMYKTTFSGSLPIRACTPKQKTIQFISTHIRFSQLHKEIIRWVMKWEGKIICR